MPRKPTGRPTGRPPGSGHLGLGITDDQERLSIRIPRELYTRFEAFAAGRSFHRGSPQLARYIREAMEEYLTRHTLRQTGSRTDAKVQNDGRQEDERALPNTSGQTGSILPLFEVERPLDVLALDALVGPPPTLDALQVDWQAPEQTAMDAVHATAPETLALMQALVDQDQAQAALVAASASTSVVQPEMPADEAVVSVPGVSDYDPTKYVLGKLCPGKHQYQGTGKSLLTIKGRRCYTCENAKHRAKRPRALDYDPAKFSLGTLCAKEGHAYRNTGQSLRTKHDRCRLCLNEANEKSRHRRKDAAHTPEADTRLMRQRKRKQAQHG